jgi:predicted RNase H-like HicB family nuclease
LTIEIWRSGKWFIAKAPELDFVSQGNTPEEAKKNLLEVIKIQFEEMEKMGSLKEYLSECGFEIREDELIPQKEIIGFEKYAISIK